MSKKAFSIALLFTLLRLSVINAEPTWKLLPTSPNSAGRVEDLCFINPLVAVCVFPGVPCKGIHIVQEPIGWHNNQFVPGNIITHQGKRKWNIQLCRIISFSHDNKGSKSRIMFYTYTKARPETAAGDEFSIGPP